jgi:hypothetical protein
VLSGPSRIVVSERLSDPNDQDVHVTDLYETYAVAQLLTRFSEAHLGATPSVSTASQSSPLAIRDNLIVIGGPELNTIALKINTAGLFQLEFALNEEGRIAVVDRETGETYVRSKERARVSGRPTETIRDYGIVASARNPFNPKARVLYLAGTSSHGTMAAVQACIEKADQIVRHAKSYTNECFECLVEYTGTAGPPGLVSIKFVRPLTEQPVIRHSPFIQHKSVAKLSEDPPPKATDRSDEGMGSDSGTAGVDKPRDPKPTF